MNYLRAAFALVGVSIILWHTYDLLLSIAVLCCLWAVIPFKS